MFIVCSRSCSSNPLESIVQRVKEMGETFCKLYAKVGFFKILYISTRKRFKLFHGSVLSKNAADYHLSSKSRHCSSFHSPGRLNNNIFCFHSTESHVQRIHCCNIQIYRLEPTMVFCHCLSLFFFL